MLERVHYRPPETPASSETASSPIAQLGTIFYRGPVPPTKGEWLGIEWDDLRRGKHSGIHEKTGIRYFETRIEGAGTFLRPTAPGLILEGKSFKEAFESKYCDAQADGAMDQRDITNNHEVDGTTSHFYKTSSNFEVEVVLSEKVAARFRHLGRLREAGLEWEALSRAHDSDERGGENSLREFGQKLAGLEVLNLSCTMLSSLEEAGRIVEVLPKLFALSLNSNRFSPILSSVTVPGFERLSILKLSNTLISWPEIVRISPSLSNLVELELGFNRLSTLISEDVSPSLPKLEVLNLESNCLNNWSETVQATSTLPNLINLILASNRFENLNLHPVPPSNPTILRKLRHLSLSSNLLSTWSTSIDALGESATSTFPSLKGLQIAGNPLESLAASSNGIGSIDGTEADFSQRNQLHQRLNIIARLPFLETLESTVIKEGERDDAERFWIAQERLEQHDRAKEASEWARGRLEELKTKHSPGITVENANVRTTSSAEPVEAPASLKSRLIRLRVCRSPSANDNSPTFDNSQEISILPTLRTLLVRAQLSRLLGKPLPKSKYQLAVYLKHKTGSQVEGNEREYIRVEIPVKEEGREIGWWGVEDGDGIGIVEL